MSTMSGTTGRKIKVAIDFDGTIVRHAFPEIGEPIANAKETLYRLYDAGCELLLFTCRGYYQEKNINYLAAAKKWLRQNGYPPFAAYNYSEWQADWTNSPKLYADIYIDDKMLFCPKLENGDIDWVKIEQELERLGVFSGKFKGEEIYR